MSRLPEPIQRMMLEMHIATKDRIRAAIRADPIKNKATLEWPDHIDPRWRFWEIKGKRGPKVRYCYTTNRNLAGYFLAFREVWNQSKGEGKRDQVVASKHRHIVKAKALARYKAHKARLTTKGEPA